MYQTYLTDQTISLVIQDEIMAETLVGWLNDQAVTTYLNFGHWPMTLAAEKEYLQNRYQDNTNLTFSIVVNENKRLIGAIGLHHIDHISQKAELGIMIGEKDCWNKGYGKRAIDLMTQHAFGRLNLRHIILWVLGSNIRGQKCYLKCGFEEVGRFPKHIFKDSAWHDKIFMLKTRS